MRGGRVVSLFPLPKASALVILSAAGAKDLLSRRRKPSVVRAAGAKDLGTPRCCPLTRPPRRAYTRQGSGPSRNVSMALLTTAHRTLVTTLSRGANDHREIVTEVLRYVRRRHRQ